MSLVFNGSVSFFATVFLPVYRFIQRQLSALFSIVFLHVRHFMKHSKPDKSWWASSSASPHKLSHVPAAFSTELNSSGASELHSNTMAPGGPAVTVAGRYTCYKRILCALSHFAHQLFLSNFIFSTYWCCTITTIHLEKVFNHFHHNCLICFLGYMQCVSFLIKQICFS